MVKDQIAKAMPASIALLMSCAKAQGQVYFNFCASRQSRYSKISRADTKSAFS